MREFRRLFAEAVSGIFLAALTARSTPWELISYCMYELRWPSVKRKAEQLRDEASDPRNRRVMELILESFDDNWEDRVLYSQ